MRACLPPDVILAFGPSKHTSEFTNGQTETWNMKRRCSVIIKVLLIIICLCLLGAHVHTGNNIPEFGVHDIHVCLFRTAHSMLAACMTSLLHARHDWLQLLSGPHIGVSGATAVCMHLQTYSHTMFNKQRALGNDLADRDAELWRREQTFKNPSQDLGFVIFSGTSSLITSAIRHRLWLLLTSALNFDQIHCLATKLRANSTNVQTY